MNQSNLSYKLIICMAVLLPWHTVLAAFDSGRAGFSITVNNEIYPYRTFATYVLPNEQLGICINGPEPGAVRVRAETGRLEFMGDCRWTWTAPVKSGVTVIRFVRQGDKETITLNVFIMVPAGRVTEGKLKGVTIGSYPPPLEDSPLYTPPDGFIEVTRNNLGTRVSPHFRLGQFVTPLNDNYPRYIVLRERLLLKLEALVERLNEKGYQAKSLSIIAGYLTPAYNAVIGGNEYSRHIYGGAAAVILDSNGDGHMDDVDGNGVLDDNDGQVLFNLIDELYREPGKSHLMGGLYYYRAGTRHRAYILLDARGYRKRWENANTAPPVLPEDLKPKDERMFGGDNAR